jgi:ketosteroid isomerase-like protein
MADNAATVQGIYDAFAKGDVPGVLGAMDPKIDWREPASLPFDDQVGPDAVGQNVFGVLFEKHFDSFSAEPTEIFDAGDAVFATGVYRGAGKSGKQLEADFVHVFRFGGDGKITYFRTYTDTKLWLDVLS